MAAWSRPSEAHILLQYSALPVSCARLLLSSISHLPPLHTMFMMLPHASALSGCLRIRMTVNDEYTYT